MINKPLHIAAGRAVDNTGIDSNFPRALHRALPRPSRARPVRALLAQKQLARLRGVLSVRHVRLRSLLVGAPFLNSNAKVVLSYDLAHICITMVTVSITLMGY